MSEHTVSKRELRAGQLEDILREHETVSLHGLYEILETSWGRVQVFTALHDLRAVGVVSLRPLGVSDVAIRLINRDEAAA